MRKCIIAGNWKMNGSKESVTTLLSEIKRGVWDITNPNVEWIVFPPFVFLPEAKNMLSGSKIAWGAQNLSDKASGAYTGEISALMLKDFNCQYVLVGHSERRAIYGESDELVAKKFVVACEAGLIPILCVGETLEEREQGMTMAVVKRQIDAVLKMAGGVSLFNKAIIAYEPVWAIGTGVNAKPEEAEAVHAEIRQEFARHDAVLAEKLQILYGGSLKPDNAKTLLAMPNIDGGLIGGASLKAKDFLDIGRVCNR